MGRLVRFVVWSVALAVASGDVVFSVEPPSPEFTRREFQAVCDRLTQGDDLYYGRAPLARVEALAARNDLSFDDRVRVSERLVYDLHRLGELDDAVDAANELVTTLRAAELAPDDPRLERALSALGMAHMQRAELQNCVAGHTPASCILPIAPGAIHRRPAEARAAAAAFLEASKGPSRSLHARWLHNLAAMVAGDFPAAVTPADRVPTRFAPVERDDRWREISADVGLHGMDLAGGAALEDFDGDGRLDIVTSSMHPCEPMKAWRNDGRGGFEDVAEAWGLTGQLGGLNLVTGDVDGDGRVDMLVLRGAWLGEHGQIRNSLLRNEVGGERDRFVDVTGASGLAWPEYPTQAASFGDYDGDGDLDLYVGNESVLESVDPVSAMGMGVGAFPSQLFRNDGRGRFEDVAEQAGVENLRFAKAVAWGDVENDGDLDLYVSNIGVNRLYRNDGDGTFTDVAAAAGVERPERSFPTWFFDADNDGDLDLFVADYGTPVERVTASYFGDRPTGGHPLLYRNDGTGRFVDVSAEVGFSEPTLPMGANYGDLDNDGFPDLYLGTGVPDFQALIPNVMYRNDGRGGFVDVTLRNGWGHVQKGHAVAFGDLDGDGDQELFQQLGGAFPYDEYRNVLYENPGSDHAWVTLRLEGREANRFGVGARIAVTVRGGEGSRTLHAVAGTGGSFGASSLQQELGLGDAESIGSIVVRWPGSGTVDRFEEVAPNRVYRVVEGAESLVEVPADPIALGGSHVRH